MTESAPRKAPQASTKQAAKQAGARQASPEQASTEQGSTEQASTEQASTEPASAKPAEAPQAGAPDTSDNGKSDMDEVKRKFREALDRKREIHAEGSSGGGRDQSKIHDAHGPARSRRDFRRKSG
jgi:hypothetical protein